MKNVVLFLGLILLFSCGGNGSQPSSAAQKKKEALASKKSSTKSVGLNPLVEGKKVFETYCVACHGQDGKLALNGAKDLTASKLTLEERITQIRDGKGLMTPYKGLLTPEEIEAVAKFTVSLNE